MSFFPSLCSFVEGSNHSSLSQLWLHGSYRPLTGRAQRHLSPASALGRFTPSVQLEGVSFLLTHLTGLETEAWMSMLPNVELSSSLPSLFSLPPHPKVKGDYSHSKTSVTKDISTSGQQQKTRASVWEVPSHPSNQAVAPATDLGADGGVDTGGLGHQTLGCQEL